MQLYTSTTTGNNNQRMQLMAVGSNYKIVMNSATNKCFDIGTAQRLAPGHQRLQRQRRPDLDPDVDSASSSYTLKNVASGRCLDIPNGNARERQPPQIYDCSASNNNQKFLITASP